MNLRKIKTIEVSTRELYKNALECLGDVLWDNCGSDTDLNLLQNLASENIDKIRQEFIDGATCVMMGEKMSIIDPHPQKRKYDVEIRIFNREGALIGVIINSEICY